MRDEEHHMPFQIIRADITKVKADAIVNTANPSVAIGDGVDSAIYKAAGEEQLLKARREVGILEPGEVGITPAFGLDARYIVHASGPWWDGGTHGEAKLLRQCYDKSLLLAADHGCESIAFPLLATGTYGFPKKLGIEIAVSSFTEFLEDHEMEIFLVVFGEKAVKISGELGEEVESLVDSDYEKAALAEEYQNTILPTMDVGARPKEDTDRDIGARPREDTVGEVGARPKDAKARVFGARPKENSLRDVGSKPKDSPRRLFSSWRKENHDDRKPLPAAPPVGTPSATAPSVGTPSATAPSVGAPSATAPSVDAPFAAPFAASSAEPPKEAFFDSSCNDAPVEESFFDTSCVEEAMGLSLEDELKGMYTDTFEKHLQQYINKKGLKNSEVYAAANISKQYFSKLLKGQVKPSKEKVLALAVGLRLNLDEAVDFLRFAGYALSPVSQTDVIVEYFIKHGDYNVMKIDIVLFDYGLEPLSKG